MVLHPHCSNCLHLPGVTASSGELIALIRDNLFSKQHTRTLSSYCLECQLQLLYEKYPSIIVIINANRTFWCFPMTKMWTARSLRSIGLRLDLICSFCSIFLPVVTATCWLVSSLFGSKYMSAWINANLNCCGCKKKKKSLAFLTAVKENNKKCQSGSKKENLTDFFLLFFLAHSDISDMLKPQRQNKEWLKDHWGHIMWCTRANSMCTHKGVYTSFPLLCHGFPQESQGDFQVRSWLCVWPKQPYQISSVKMLLETDSL